MKRITAKHNSFLKRFLINIPFVLIVALAAACFFGGAACVFYCVVTAVAYRSAMISLILVGAGLILTGAALGLVVAFKRYYAFYDKQMGWEYPDRPAPPENTAVYDKKTFRQYLTVQNFALAFLAIGAVFTIISAALGSISRDNWVKAIGPYREARGYYADVKRIDYPVFIEDGATHEYILDDIVIDLETKQAVIVFTDEPDKLGKITVKAFFSYEHQVDFYMSDSTFFIRENPAPSYRRTALDKLLFFADDILRSVPVSAERQIVVYLPASLEGKVAIEGEYIEAK